MSLIKLWQHAQSPNYITNIDKEYPYSELPFLAEYNLIKIPHSLDTLVDHVDYWGEGKVHTTHGYRGYSDCYNINLPYELVSEGPDHNRKIPNRIPVESVAICNTSAYIKDNHVSLVTIKADLITNSCATDIARMVNSDLGKVIVFGQTNDSNKIAKLATELKDKKLYYCPSYKLPSDLQEEPFTDYTAYLNVDMFKEEILKLVIGGDYETAIILTKTLAINQQNEALRAVVEKLLTEANTNAKIMSYAYQLWENDAKEVVYKQFPEPLKLIYDGKNLTIINKQYQQALKLDINVDSYKDRLALGSIDNLSEKVSWRLIPVWENNEVTFKLHNLHYNMYLKLDVNVISIGDRSAWGSQNSEEDRHRFYLEPLMKDREVEFSIINYKYGQRLKLAEDTDAKGDRRLFCDKGSDHKDEERFKWILSEWYDEETLKNKLSQLVSTSAYDDAVSLAINFANSHKGKAIGQVVTQLLNDSKSRRNVIPWTMSFWRSSTKHIVRNYFPPVFKHILEDETVTIVNKAYGQALKLSTNVDIYYDRLAWGENEDRTSLRVCWRLIPCWEHNEVTFQLYNPHCFMYLKLDVNVDDIGDRSAWGSQNPNEERYRYYLEPFMNDGNIEFSIINYKYGQALKLAVETDAKGDRRLWGHNGDIYNGEERFKWILSEWLKVDKFKIDLQRLVTSSMFDSAVILTKIWTNGNKDEALHQVVLKLCEDSFSKTMAYGYQLWINDSKDVVMNHFPDSFMHIFGGENMTIINKEYKQALKLDANLDAYNDRLAWGDSSDKTSRRVCWRFLPLWENNTLVFKLYNVDYNMYLKLDVNVDSIGDRKAWGSVNSGEDRHKYYLEPTMKDGKVEFCIINYQLGQGLKLAVAEDSIGDRQLFGHNGNIHSDEERFKWILSKW